MLNQVTSLPILLKQINKVVSNHPEAFQSFGINNKQHDTKGVKLDQCCWGAMSIKAILILNPQNNGHVYMRKISPFLSRLTEFLGLLR